MDGDYSFELRMMIRIAVVDGFGICAGYCSSKVVAKLKNSGVLSGS